MSIIAILTAMLLPAVSKARKSAMVIACSGNMRQIGQLIIAYADDYQGYPPSSDRGFIFNWELLNAQAQPAKRGIYVCPSMNTGSLVQGSDFAYFWTSYVESASDYHDGGRHGGIFYNDLVSPYSWPARRYDNLLPNSVTIMEIGGGSDISIANLPLRGVPSGATWLYISTLISPWSANNTASRLTYMNHDLWGNFSFADGHVQKFNSKTVFTSEWVPGR